MDTSAKRPSLEQLSVTLTQKLKLYNQSLGNGDSIIRSFILIDHAYFVLEQEISVTVMRQSGAWTGEYALT